MRHLKVNEVPIWPHEILLAFAATLDGTAGPDELTGTDGDDVLSGFAGNDRLIGGAGNDVLNGGEGVDQLDGGTGTDTMTGGDGNDRYFVRDAGDLVIETSADKATGGDDFVYSYISTYTLPEHVEGGAISAGSAATFTLIGNALDNVLQAAPRINILDGRGGVDTVNFFQAYSQSNATGVTIDLAITGPQDTGSIVGVPGTHTLISIENVWGGNNQDRISGDSGNNQFIGYFGDDYLDGRGGIDTSRYSRSKNSYTITRTQSGIEVKDNTSARDGRDTLTSIERLQFSDGSIAFDLDGNAGKAAKILGAVLGVDAVRNATFAGIGIHYLDQGMSYEALIQLALEARLGANASHRAVVDLLFTNLIGQAPSDQQAKPFVDLLSSHAMTVSALAAQAADIDINASRIDLVGLAQTGLAYIEYTP